MIRVAAESDESVLLDLIGEFYEIDGHPFDLDVVTSGLRPLLESDRFGIVLLAEDDGPVGYAAVAWSYSIESGGPDALLDEIYVRERGRGIGRRLMEATIEEVRSRGMTRLFLETEADNDAARRFYRDFGFEVEDSIWMATDL